MQPRRAGALTLTVWLTLVLLHYFWTVEPGRPFTPFQHYHLLTDAFLAGRVSLEPPPPPELLALPDPYDPESNAPWRACRDCSLFGGRYYLYFGAAPVLTLFLPFRLLTGVQLEEKHAAMLFFWGSVVLQSALVLFVGRRFCPRAGRSTRALLLLLVAFSNFQPFILRRAIVYEVPPAAGAFFVSGAVLCLLLGTAAERPSALWLLLGSLCLGLAVASRPHHVLVTPLLLPLLARLGRRPGRPRENWRLAAAMLLPLVLCCAGIAAYNHHRFGRFWEFGQSYVLAEVNFTTHEMVSLENISSHLALSLLAPPSVDFDFPFFHMYPAWFPDLPHPRRQLESTAGVFACVPAAGLALASPLLLWRRRADGRTLAAWSVGLLLAGLTTATFVASHRVTSVRYLPDFCTYFLLSAALVALQLDHGLAAARSVWRALFRAALLVLISYGTIVNLAVGLTGYYDLYRKTRPQEYARIEDAFFPLQRQLLRWSGPHGALRLELQLPERPSPKAETLVRLDGDAGEDALCVRRARDGGVVFRFHHGSERSLRSVPLSLEPGSTHVLELQAGSLYPHLRERVLARLFPSAQHWNPRNSVRIALDGAEILVAQLELAPGGSRVALDALAGVCPVPFSGRIIRAERELP